MRDLSAAELLAAWERGLAEPGLPHPALALLAAAAEQPVAVAARLPIGRRDADLLCLRERLFGGRLICLTHCPACGDVAEFTAEVASLLGDDPPAADEASVRLGPYDVLLRPADSLALASAARTRDVAAARGQLLAACLVAVHRDGERVAPEALPEDLLAAVEDRLAGLDPAAELSAPLTCPGCGLGWEAVLDPAGFVWEEVCAWAERTLGEVHALASAYGWSEGEILGLSTTRRRLYLERVGSA